MLSHLLEYTFFGGWGKNSRIASHRDGAVEPQSLCLAAKFLGLAGQRQRLRSEGLYLLVCGGAVR